jgi:hypothetical protein
MKKDRKTKNTIYSDYELFDLVDDDEWWAEEIELGCADKDDDRWEHAYSTLEYYLECEQANLNIDVGNTIIQIADLGLWDGVHHAYKEEKSQNIADLLVRTCEYCEWYCDAHDLRGKMSHHDGTNYILYRRRKDGITDYQWDNFLYKLYTGTANKEHISKYTTSLLPYIAEVYGWKYRKNNRKVA